MTQRIYSKIGTNRNKLLISVLLCWDIVSKNLFDESQQVWSEDI